MTGLSILYASEGAKERDWAVMPDRDRAGRLREVYWARRTESKLGRKSFVNMTLNWRPDRAAIGRRSDDPGDGFVYLISMAPRVEERFEWLEVTEVFTTVPASRIEGAMRAWNGIPNKRPVNFEEFRGGLKLGRPSRIEQGEHQKLWGASHAASPDANPRRHAAGKDRLKLIRGLLDCSTLFGASRCGEAHRPPPHPNRRHGETPPPSNGVMTPRRRQAHPQLVRTQRHPGPDPKAPNT